jgi:hypothetical protein
MTLTVGNGDWWYVRGLQYERHFLDDLAMELMDRRNNFQVRLYTF